MPKRRKATVRPVVELVGIVVVAVLLAFGIQAYIVKPYKIPSKSMLPTLKVGQRILVDRIGMHFGKPHIGEIMVFYPPKVDDGDGTGTICADPSQGAQAPTNDNGQACDVAQDKHASTAFVKRVVGLPGDHLQIINGHVIRNGVQEDDSYTIACGAETYCNYRGVIVVPKGEYYMMGDNRGDSEDSRFWGPVKRSWLIGDAFFTYWPLDRFGTL